MHEQKIDEELMEYYDQMQGTLTLFHRKKKIVNELMDEELYISPEYLENSLQEIKSKNLDDKIIKIMDKMIRKLSNGNFVKLLLLEMKEALTNIGKQN